MKKVPEQKEQWMRRALVLARKGEGKTSPNPTVGAMIVKHGKVLAEGYHKRAGGPHAEIEALGKAGNKAKGATLVVTLEPCGHFGKTPPCTEAIIEAGIRDVLIGVRDPNPEVRGRGVRKLKAAGLKVETGILKGECQTLIEYFSKFIQSGKPYVILKSAVSLDGKIATAKGESKWITGPKARQRVHQLRAQVDAILVGAQTVIQDNPSLTARPSPKNKCYPTRVLLDPNLRISLKAKVFNNAQTERVVVVTRPGHGARKNTLIKMGVLVIEILEKRGTIPFEKILKELGKMDIVSLLIEGGGETSSRILNERAVDRVMWFMAPIIIGGRDAIGAVGGIGVQKLKSAWRLKNLKVEQVDQDILIEGEL